MGAEQDFVLRIAVSADVPVLQALIAASVRGLSQGDYTPEEMEGSIGHVLGLDTQLVEDGTYFVAECVTDLNPGSSTGTPRIAGCGGWSYRTTLCGSDHAPNREMTPLVPGKDAAKIRAIFVHPDYARRGLGSLILRHCEDAAWEAGYRAFEMGSTLTGVPLYTLKGYQARERVDIALCNGATLPVLRMTKSV